MKYLIKIGWQKLKFANKHTKMKGKSFGIINIFVISKTISLNFTLRLFEFSIAEKAITSVIGANFP